VRERRLTAILGPALASIPIDSLRIAIGTLLLLFGLQWLYKATLRAAGLKARHDETIAYTREVDEAERTERPPAGEPDWYSFTLSFKGVLLEGLEVVFIVITFGDNQRNLGAAVLGGAIAVVVVAVTGIAVRAPLAKVPANAMKFAVGIMLTSFGTFWGAEGAGVAWPGRCRASTGRRSCWPPGRAPR
jgi:uncharacterized membrane protein